MNILVVYEEMMKCVTSDQLVEELVRNLKNQRIVHADLPM